MEKLNEVIKFLQSKQVGLSVSEINSICAIIQGEIETLSKPKEEKNATK